MSKISQVGSGDPEVDPELAPEERQAIDEAVGALQRLSDAFGLRRQQLAAEVGITEAQWRVLEEISTEHFMPSMFARARDCSPAAVSKVLRPLLDRGLVRAEIGAHDARQRAYRLTAAGRALMRALRAAREQAIREVWVGLDRGSLDRFSRFSQTLADRLERYASAVAEEKTKVRPRKKARQAGPV